MNATVVDEQEELIPEVRASAPSLIAKIIVGILVFCAIAFLVWTLSLSEGGSTDTEEINFSTGGQDYDVPKLKMVAAPPKPEPKEVPRPESPQRNQQLWHAIQAPSVIYTAGDTSRQTPVGGLDQLQQLTALNPSTANSMGGGDPYAALAQALGGGQQQSSQPGYQQFADQARNTAIGRSYAQQMQNLDYTILAGSIIPIVVESATQSGLTNMVVGLVSQDVYASRGNKIMIPKGSEITGQALGEVAQSQNRQFGIIQRIVTPRGILIEPGSVITGPLGRTGMTANVNRHFWERLGNALIVSLVGIGASEINNPYGQAAGLTFQQQLANSLADGINRPPTLTTPQGQRGNIILERDLDFSNVYR